MSCIDPCNLSVAIINANAERLNKEGLDALDYQAPLRIALDLDHSETR